MCEILNGTPAILKPPEANLACFYPLERVRQIVVGYVLDRDAVGGYTRNRLT